MKAIGALIVACSLAACTLLSIASASPPAAARGRGGAAPARDLLLGGADLDHPPDDARLRRPQLQLPRGVGDLLARPHQPPAGRRRSSSAAAIRTAATCRSTPTRTARPTDALSDIRDRAAARAHEPVRRRRPARPAQALLAGDGARRAGARRRRRARAEHALRPARRRRGDRARLPRLRARPRPRPRPAARACRGRCCGSPTAARPRRAGLRGDQRPEPRDRRADDPGGAVAVGAQLAGLRPATPTPPTTRSAGSASSTSTTPRSR